MSSWIKVKKKGKVRAYHMCVDCMQPILDDNSCGCFNGNKRLEEKK